MHDANIAFLNSLWDNLHAVLEDYDTRRKLDEKSEKKLRELIKYTKNQGFEVEATEMEKACHNHFKDTL